MFAVPRVARARAIVVYRPDGQVLHRRQRRLFHILGRRLHQLSTQQQFPRQLVGMHMTFLFHFYVQQLSHLETEIANKNT